MKRIDYEQRIREIEHSSFTPLVFSATGGMAKQAMTFTNAWPPYLLKTWYQPYGSTLCWLHTLLHLILSTEIYSPAYM